MGGILEAVKTLWLAALLLAPPARAGDVVTVNFVTQSRVMPSQAVQSWSPGLASLFSGLSQYRLDGPLAKMAGLDFHDARHAATFEPLVLELAKAGYSPDEFARASAQTRAQAAKAAFAAVSQAHAARIERAAAAVEAALAEGAEQALTAAVELLREESAAGVYLSEASRARVGAAHRAALALQTEERARTALARLREDAESLWSGKPVETVLARAPSAAFSPAAAEGKLVKFEPAKRKPKAAPVVELKQGQNPALYLKGRMLGLTHEEAASFSAASFTREDLGSRYAAAYDAAVEKAKLAGYEAGQVYFGEASMRVGARGEPWGFDFYALKDAKDRSGHIVRARFAADKSGTRLVMQTAEFTAVPEGLTPLRLPVNLLYRAFRVSPAEALRRARGQAPPVDVGLTISARAIPEPVSFDTDIWYVISHAGSELARVNGSTGELRLPAPAAAAPAKSRWALAWEKLLGFLRSRHSKG